MDRRKEEGWGEEGRKDEGRNGGSEEGTKGRTEGGRKSERVRGRGREWGRGGWGREVGRKRTSGREGDRA